MALLLVVGVLLLATLAAVAHRFRRRRPDDTRGRIASDLLAGGLIYTFAAPAIGGAAVVLGVTAASRDLENLMMAIYGLPWFYIFGALPALLCGIVAGALRPTLPSWRYYCLIALVGGLFGTLFLAGFSNRERQWSELLFPLSMGGLPGLVGGFLCTYWFYGKRRAATPPGSATPSQERPDSAA